MILLHEALASLQRWHKHRRRLVDGIVSIFHLLLGAYIVVSLSQIIATFAPDFSVFYHSARNVLAGRSVYNDPLLYTGFNYLPHTLLLFLPFTVLQYQMAQGVWIIISYICFVLSITLCVRLFWTRVTYPSIVLLLASSYAAFPSRFTFGMGQINWLALLFLLIGCLAHSKHKSFLSGVLFAIAILCKPQLAFIVLVCLVRREWSVLGSLIGSSLVVVVGWTVVFGYELYVQYATEVLPRLLPFTGRAIYYNQGLSGFISRVVPIEYAEAVNTWSSIALILCLLWALYAKRMRPLREAICISIPVMLLVEPLAWQHHLVFLMPVYIALLGASRFSRREVGVLFGSYMLVSINISHPEMIASWPLSGLVLSHGTVGIMVLLGYVWSKFLASR